VPLSALIVLKKQGRPWSRLDATASSFDDLTMQSLLPNASDDLAAKFN
jgi:hypothetical protein